MGWQAGWRERAQEARKPTWKRTRSLRGSVGNSGGRRVVNFRLHRRAPSRLPCPSSCRFFFLFHRRQLHRRFSSRSAFFLFLCLLHRAAPLRDRERVTLAPPRTNTSDALLFFSRSRVWFSLASVKRLCRLPIVNGRPDRNRGNPAAADGDDGGDRTYQRKPAFRRPARLGVCVCCARPRVCGWYTHQMGIHKQRWMFRLKVMT